MEQDAGKRTLPLATDRRRFSCACGHSTHNSASRALESFLSLARHENGQERAIGTIWNARTSSCSRESDLVAFAHTIPRAKKQPSRTWSERLPAVCIFGRIGISRVSFCEVVLVFVVVFVACFVLFLFCLFGCVCTFVRARLCFFLKKKILVFLRASLIFWCNFGWGSDPPREPRRRHPDCSVQTSTRKYQTNSSWQKRDHHREMKPS